MTWDVGLQFFRWVISENSYKNSIFNSICECRKVLASDTYYESGLVGVSTHDRPKYATRYISHFSHSALRFSCMITYSKQMTWIRVSHTIWLSPLVLPQPVTIYVLEVQTKNVRNVAITLKICSHSARHWVTHASLSSLAALREPAWSDKYWFSYLSCTSYRFNFYFELASLYSFSPSSEVPHYRSFKR